MHIYGNSVEIHVRTTWCGVKFLLEGLELYEDIQMRAYDITKSQP